MPKECVVRFKVEDVTRETHVHASSVYEASARALAVFRSDDWSMDETLKTGYLEIVILQPEVKHKILLRDFESWLTRQGRTTKDMQHRELIRRLLKGEGGG